MFFKFIFILSFRHFHKNIKFFLKIYHLKMEAKISARIREKSAIFSIRRLLICLGGTTRFPMAGQSFYDGYSINYPLQQDKTLIALHIYSQSITNRPAINLKVTETVSAYWNHLCANVNITPPPLLKGQFLHQKTHFP